MEFTTEYSKKINKLKALLLNAEAVVIGAGAGLSTAAGFTYSGKRFHENFHDFEAKYNFHDMYSGGFFPYETQEEYWAYWSRYIFLNRYSKPPKPLYDMLLSLVENKNYFVITTNVDHCFQNEGFDKQRLFCTQGDYGLFQCSAPCHNKTYYNEALVRQMVETQSDMKIPSELIPRCPVCGKPMTMNLRCDDKFVEDDGWHAAAKRYNKFLSENAGGKTLFFELGVGYNTPAIIKFPFIRATLNNKNAFYASVNLNETADITRLTSRTLIINEDIYKVIADLQNA